MFPAWPTQRQRLGERSSRTTMSESLRIAGVETKVRRCCLEATRSALLPLRKAIGASFDAIVATCERGGVLCIKMVDLGCTMQASRSFRFGQSRR